MRYTLFSMQKVLAIFRESVPILIMIGLIPIIKSDIHLTVYYCIIIAICLRLRKEKHDMLFFFFGFGIMIVFEYLFISTGVEIFLRNSLFGIMPLWLPFLWGYGFVAIKRSVKIIEGK